MNAYVDSQSMSGYGQSLLRRWLRKEMDSLSTKKEALDAEYPRHTKHIPPGQMRSMAYESLLQRICRPPSASNLDA
jgi:hypothetical protein|uniref:Uncharacterized protein n=1 Tax=Desulfomonile tiedjei TaxID=2358 RepID=A0A7C4EUT4_9BACT